MVALALRCCGVFASQPGAPLSVTPVPASPGRIISLVCVRLCAPRLACRSKHPKSGQGPLQPLQAFTRRQRVGIDAEVARGFLPYFQVVGNCALCNHGANGRQQQTSFPPVTPPVPILLSPPPTGINASKLTYSISRCQVHARQCSQRAIKSSFAEWRAQWAPAPPAANAAAAALACRGGGVSRRVDSGRCLLCGLKVDQAHGHDGSLGLWRDGEGREETKP